MGEQGQKVDHPTPQHAWDNRAPTIPLKVGWLQPDDILPAAVFLASDAANMVAYPRLAKKLAMAIGGRSIPDTIQLQHWLTLVPASRSAQRLLIRDLREAD
jgi:hypothetical protein